MKKYTNAVKALYGTQAVGLLLITVAVSIGILNNYRYAVLSLSFASLFMMVKFWPNRLNGLLETIKIFLLAFILAGYRKISLDDIPWLWVIGLGAVLTMGNPDTFMLYQDKGNLSIFASAAVAGAIIVPAIMLFTITIGRSVRWVVDFIKRNRTPRLEAPAEVKV